VVPRSVCVAVVAGRDVAVLPMAVLPTAVFAGGVGVVVARGADTVVARLAETLRSGSRYRSRR